MNPVLELIHKRRSVRVYDPTPISDEEKDAILQAAMRAPTAGAMMLYSIIEVADPALKQRLVETCDHQPFIAKAPLVLLFLADYQRWMDMFSAAGSATRAGELGIPNRLPAEGDLVLALMDALIAAQTAVLAAESLGIGSCYIGDVLENWETHQEIFNLPQYTFPAALLCFGRPADPPPSKLVPRFDKQFIVHQDSYQRFEKDQLNDVFLPFGFPSFDLKEYKNGAHNPVQHNYLRKFTADFSREMNRSTAVMIRKWCGQNDPSEQA